MPTSAATGTKNVSTAGSKSDKKDEAKSEHEDPKQDPSKPQPYVPIDDGGFVEVVAEDGSIRAVNTGEEGWEDKVRELDPKHQSIRNA